MHPDGGSEPQKRQSVGSGLVESADLLLSYVELFLRRILLLEALIELHQIHVHLDAVKRPFGRTCGHMRQNGLVFLHRIFVAVLEPRNLSPDRVQPVMIVVQMLGAVEEDVGLVDCPHSHLRLCGRKLQCEILGHGIRGLRVKAGGLCRLAVQLVGIGQLGQHIRPRLANGLERGDRFLVAARLEEIASERSLYLGIVRRAVLGHLQVAICLIELLQMLVAQGQQDL